MSTRRTRGPNIVDNTILFKGTGNYQIYNEANLFIKKAVGAATTVFLPPSVVPGFEVFIMDANGDAATNNITIQGATTGPFPNATIDGASSLVINVGFGAVNLVWNGGEWSVAVSKSIIGGATTLGPTNSPVATAQVIATSGTVTLPTTGFIALLNPSGAVTAIIIPAGTKDGQLLRIINKSAFLVTFDVVANSHVANGASSSIAALTAGDFTWSSANSLWYHTQAA